MGGVYAMTSLVKLVALFGKDGITKEEILRLNKESYNAKLDWDYQFSNALSMSYELVQFREGKYYPNLEKIDMDKAEKSYKKIMKERS
jgi:hypothetical protein